MRCHFKSVYSGIPETPTEKNSDAVVTDYFQSVYAQKGSHVFSLIGL